MYNRGVDGNNSSINKRERLILILPFLTGFDVSFALWPVFCVLCVVIDCEKVYGKI